MATPKFTPLAGRSSRSDQVYVALREALLAGAFTPGDQLREGEIAAQLGVSKTPVREALSRLRAKGLLKASATRGILVTQIDDNTLKWLYEVRSLLEPEAVRRAIPFVDDRLIAQARLLLTDAEGYGERHDFTALSRSNRDFHELLYGRCDNLQLQHILNDMRDQLQFIAASGWRQLSTSWEIEHREHTAILDAVAKREAAHAAELDREHIEISMRRLLAHDDRSAEEQPNRSS